MTIKDQYWLRSGAINIIHQFSGVFFGFASFFILVRVLDKHSFGTWTLFMSTITVMEVVRGGLIQNAIIRFVASTEKKEHPQILTASLAISASLTALCVIINSSIAEFLSTIWNAPELSSMFYFYSIAYVISGVLSFFNNIEQAHLKFKGVLLSSTVKMGTFFTYVLICLILKHKLSLITLVHVQIISLLLSTIVAYWSVKEHLILSKAISTRWIFKLLGYGKYAFGTSISSILSSTIDQMMLGGILSASASGAFNIAVRITNIVDIPTNAMATIVFPQSARRMETEGKEAIKYLYEKSVGTILAILMPGIIFILLFTDLIIYLVAGEKYSDTVSLLQVTLLYCIFIPYGRQSGTILNSIGKQKINFYLVLITTALNLCLNFLFITSYGLIGAAYATLLSGFIGFILSQLILARELQIAFLNTLWYMLKFYPEFLKIYILPAKNRLFNGKSTKTFN